MPFDGKDVPHLVIEVNQTCNLTCAACCKIKQPYSKDVALIKEEIDLGVRRRNLDMITLAGGEPTLHPDLPEIITYVRDRGIKVSMLTNGVALTDEKLRQYRRAGLGRVVLHVDAWQRRPDCRGATTERDLNRLREAILRRVHEQGMRGGLAVTAYRRNLAELADVLDFAFASPWVSLVLVTCCRQVSRLAHRLGRADLSAALADEELDGQEPTSVEVMELVERAFGVAPTHYIGSNLRPTEKRWLLWLVFAITDARGRYRLQPLSSAFPRTIRLGNALQRLLKGHYKFDMVPGPSEAVLLCLAYGMLSLDARNLVTALRFVARLWRPGTAIASKVVVVQQLPNVTEEGRLEYCKDCPDATVRNGQIVPVCMADVLSPIGSRDETTAVPELAG